RSLYGQILRRIDVRLLPFAVTVYFFSQLDKHNLGQAHARDFDADLHLKGNQFAGLLSIYFPCYLILHYISGIFLAQLRPRRLIPTTVLWCGVTTFCLTFCTNFTQMALGRLLLGMFEGSLSPCITILFASWYPMEKIATRLMLLHLASPISGLIGACVTAGFYQLDGMDGLQGWQWMFCVEGLTTILISFPGYWLLPNLVEQDGDRFKTNGERQIQRGKSRVPLNDFTWHQVLRPFTELKIYLYSITAASSQVASSNIANFGPMIIKEMGYEGAKINLLSAGPLALSVFIMLICAVLADRKGMRSSLLLPCLSLITIGQFLIFFDIHSKSVTYGAMYLIAGFSGPCNTLITVWCAGNIGPQYTKMATLALCLLSHTSATLISVNLFPPTDAPLFWHAHLAGLICIVIAIVSASLLTLVLWFENHKREKKAFWNLEHLSNEEFARLGDRHPGIRY
ncbi:MFS general substrate transporter, partial [Meira miltonrushii]